jgi:hypothetical protein
MFVTFVEYDYLLTLALMTIWAIAYPSYTSLILLLWTTPFWLQAKEFFMTNLPALTYYATFCVVFQYIASLAPLGGDVCGLVLSICCSSF